MKLIRKSVFFMLALVTMMLITACGASNNEEKHLLVSHAHNEWHPVHKGLLELRDKMGESTDYTFSIYPSSQLGGNTEMIQMVRAGVLDIAKVSSSGLEQFNSAYSIFSLPYVFKSQDHYFRTMRESEAVKEIFESTYDQGFVAIGWYDSGQRSIYTGKEGGVTTPEELAGLKIRTQDSPTSIEMIRNMGASPTPMDAGEIYSALQQGIIDGAENNETVMADNGHGEIAKSYVYTEHQYTPDIVIMSTKTYEKLSSEELEELLLAMDASWQVHQDDWVEIVERNKKEAVEMGVGFYEIDKTPFIEACLPQQEAFRNKSEKNAEYLDDFLSYVENE